MKNLVLFILSLFFGYSSIQGQALVPRFHWLDFLDTTSVDAITMPQLRQAIDSIDFTTISKEDLKYLDERIDGFNKRWMAVYGNKIPESNPAATIFVGGMDCDKCVNWVGYEILSIPGIEKIREIVRSENMITYHYFPEFEATIREAVQETLKKRFENCGYTITQPYEIDFPEVQEQLQLEIQYKEKLGLQKCYKHD
jgi:hypothetical protein